MKSYVLDACALIAFYLKEPGYDKVMNVLSGAASSECIVYMNNINVLEIYYGFFRDDGESTANNFLASCLMLPIEIINGIDPQTFKIAGKLKAVYRISLADSIAVAESITRQAELITSDHHEFDILEAKQECRFLWIR
jgi:PIN domain nuclease of toxin-antitoxin system